MPNCRRELWKEDVLIGFFVVPPRWAYFQLKQPRTQGRQVHRQKRRYFLRTLVKRNSASSRAESKWSCCSWRVDQAEGNWRLSFSRKELLGQYRCTGGWFSENMTNVPSIINVNENLIKFTAWTLLCCRSRRYLHQVQNTKKSSAEIIKVTIQNTLGCKEVKSNTTGVKANIEMIFKILKPHRIFRNRELLLTNPPSICRWSKNLLARPYNYVLSTHVNFQRNFQLNPIMFSYIYSSLSIAGSRP